MKSSKSSSRTKRHKSKGRHHKEKRKKRKHQKSKDPESSSAPIKKDDPWEFASESDTEKVDNLIEPEKPQNEELSVIEEEKTEIQSVEQAEPELVQKEQLAEVQMEQSKHPEANPVQKVLSDLENTQEVKKHKRRHEDDEVAHKKEKRRHHHHQAKKSRDVRKAPQDGIVVADQENQDTTAPAPILEEVETPRLLAIKIKLCQECNSRHLQDACPLLEPAFTITDSVTLQQWVHAHQGNEEAMKAFNIADPIAQGYDKDDGFDSDGEESAKSKDTEEKQLIVDSSKPLYARDSLPECLELRMATGEHGLGVFVKGNSVPTYAQFGPLVGKPVQEMDIPDDFPMRHIWEVRFNQNLKFKIIYEFLIEF